MARSRRAARTSGYSDNNAPIDRPSLNEALSSDHIQLEHADRLGELFQELGCRRTALMRLHNRRVQIVHEYSNRRRHFEDSVNEVQSVLQEPNDDWQRSIESNKRQRLEDSLAVLRQTETLKGIEAEAMSVQHAVRELEQSIYSALQELLRSTPNAATWLMFMEPPQHGSSTDDERREDSYKSTIPPETGSSLLNNVQPLATSIARVSRGTPQSRSSRRR